MKDNDSCPKTVAEKENNNRSTGEYTDRKLKSLSGLLPSLVLILLGVLFLLSSLGILKDSWWQYFLVCIAAILLIYTLVECLKAQGKKIIFIRIIWGIILIAIGIIFLLNPNEWWPLILIAGGLILLVKFIFQNRRNA